MPEIETGSKIYRNKDVNFENILSVKLFHDDEDNECLYEIYTTVNAPGDNYILLGEYNTEKRAIEILQEIVNVAKEEEFFWFGNIFFIFL